MGMIGNAAQAVGNYFSGPIPLADRLSSAGAALGGDAATAAAIRQHAVALLRTQQAMSQLNGLFGGQAQYQDGPAPTVAAPATPGSGPAAPAPATMDDLSGALGAATSSMAPGPAAPAQPYQYQPPQRVPGPGQAASLQDPRTQRALTQASLYLPEQSKFMLDLLDKAQPSGRAVGDNMVDTHTGRVLATIPHPQYINGYRVDPNSPNAPAYIPQLDKMTMPDGRGGVMAIPGATDATGQLAGATTNAQEAAKAAYDLIPVPQSDGSTRLMPRSVALGALTGQSGAPAAHGVGGGVGGGAGGAAPQLGVSQSPAEAELAKARAATQGKNETDISGAKSAMQQVDDQTNMIAQNLHDMLGETQDPNTGKWVKTKPSMIGHLSTGSGTDVIEHIPFLNQQAKDLGAKIETVRNGTSFNSLQAIKNALSAAGDGGSGSIRMTDQTARMLGEINGSLNQDQSGPQFEATVRRHLAQLEALNSARHDLFSSQYKGVRPTTPGQTGPTANYNKPAQSSPRVPQAGDVVKGYRFLGGNPASPQSWAKN